MNQEKRTIPALLSERYHIISVLGSGGFCDTFLAEDTQMPSARRCVIKQLKPVNESSLIQEQIQKRFRREAITLEDLGATSHQIPSLYAYFQKFGQFYLVQEWIDGQTLFEKVQQSGCLSETEVVSILISLLDVLEYVHDKGLIHRDIKPDNIILRSSDHKPVLIDFGAVRETMGTVVNSQGSISSSIIVGTAGFMPNEQAAGRPVFASDLYSLGLTAIYLLTGQLPQQMTTDLYTGESIWQRDGVSASLAAVLDKAIRNNIKERYPSARAMIYALQSIASSLAFGQVAKRTQPPAQTLPTTLRPAAENKRQNSIFIGSVFMIGALFGTSIIIGLLLTNFRQPTAYKKETSSGLITKPQRPDASFRLSPSGNPSSQMVHKQLMTGALPSSFHFIADSTFPNLQSAVKQTKTLQGAGYSQTDVFWIPDYPNLVDRHLFVVYVTTFSDRSSCLSFLRDYGKANPSAYCAFASKDPKAPTARVSFREIQ
ncbi:MAG: serine/threonine protein kinase [Brasilonema octagenarum HA4186-MV1]|jgi:serine/threonine-protein kinase|uniref:serine/threonine-protein kinase n=1 Tax=Brasilonema TaxID=383614 RepID=UPI001B7CFE4A|nr:MULTISPECIES: serine/threonine-protein kinase [Brasilonema]MBW4624732.1 serine/threonine protein kinase [Brasilonema octagenarum HA4186-MV1]